MFYNAPPPPPALQFGQQMGNPLAQPVMQPATSYQAAPSAPSQGLYANPAGMIAQYPNPLIPALGFTGPGSVSDPNYVPNAQLPVGPLPGGTFGIPGGSSVDPSNPYGAPVGGNGCYNPTGPAPLRVTYLGGLFTGIQNPGNYATKFQTQFASFKGLKLCLAPQPPVGFAGPAVGTITVIEISANQFNYLPGQFGVPPEVFAVTSNESDGRIDLPWITNQNYINVVLAYTGVALVGPINVGAAFQGIAAG